MDVYWIFLELFLTQKYNIRWKSVENKPKDSYTYLAI